MTTTVNSIPIVYQATAKFPRDQFTPVEKFEPVIRELATSYLDGRSFHWEEDPDVANGTYARLVRSSDGAEVITGSLSSWQRCPLDEFRDLLKEKSHRLPAPRASEADPTTEE